MNRLHMTIALGYLTARKRQTFISFFAIMLGVVAYIVVSALVNGNELSFIEQAINITPHIIITDDFKDVVDPQPADYVFQDSWNGVEHIQNNTQRQGIKNHSFMLHSIRQEYPEISAAPVLKQQVFLKHGGNDVSSQCFGIIPNEQNKISKLSENLAQGSLESLTYTPNGIIIGIELAKKLHVGIGSTLDVVSTSGLSFKMSIVGLLQTGIVSIDYHNSYISLGKAQTLFGQRPVINEIQMKLSDVNKAQEISRLIQQEYHYPTNSWIDLSANIFSIFKLQRVIIFVVVLSILVMASIGIYNMISTIVYDKYRDISILKSMGFDCRDIRTIFLLQGMIICFFGVILGWFFAYLTIYLLGLIRVDIVGFVRTNRLILYQDVWLYLRSAGASFFVAFIATLLSIRKAIQLNPVDIIRVSL